jgi:hypothetical protein
VQYFERARFEYHPENPAPHDILLGQLGREQFVARYPGGAPGIAQGRVATAATPTRSQLLTQIAAMDTQRATLPQGAANHAHQGWAEYDRAIGNFLAVHPALHAYLLWYYHQTTPGAAPGLTYHPSGATLSNPALLDQYLASQSTPKHGR